MKISNNLTSFSTKSKEKSADEKQAHYFSSSILSSSNKMAPAPSGPSDSAPNKPITRSTASAWNNDHSNVDFFYSNKLEKTRFESDDAWTSHKVLLNHSNASNSTITSTSDGNGKNKMNDTIASTTTSNGTNAKKIFCPTIVDPIKPTNFDPTTALATTATTADETDNGSTTKTPTLKNTNDDSRGEKQRVDDDDDDDATNCLNQ